MPGTTSSRAGVRKSGRLRWGLRRYGRAVMAVAVAFGVVAALAAARSEPRGSFHARALVVANEAAIGVEPLAEFGREVFASPDVARRAAAAGNLGPDAPALLRRKVTMQPVDGTVLFYVEAIDDDPVVAASLANLVATAFLDELNEAGEGVGRFGLQSAASTPARRTDDRPAAVVAGLLGSLGGGLLALAVLWAVLALRRPVVAARQAAAAASAPVVADVALARPRRRATGRDPGAGLGLAARRMLVPGGEPVVVVPCRGAEAASHDVVAGLIEILRRRQLEGGAPAAVRSVGDAAGATPDEVDDTLLSGGRAVVIVHEGAREADVREAAGQFARSELEGVLFVRAGQV